MENTARIFVAGHAGLLGAALCRRLHAGGYTQVQTVARGTLDLRDAGAVTTWMRAHRPDYVLMAAGTVGGLRANIARPVDFIADNLAIQTAVLAGAHAADVQRVLLLGCTCMYPSDAAQPLRESSLGQGLPEASSRPYAIAKLAALTMAEAYAAQYGLHTTFAIPGNLYGPHDNFSLSDGHVVAALIQRCLLAHERGDTAVRLGGTGQARRDFLFVDDAADACLRLLAEPPSPDPVNIGSGSTTSIAELVSLIRDEVAPGLRVIFEGTGPDGVPMRSLDPSRMAALGWSAPTPLLEGIRRTCAWVRSQRAAGILPRGWSTSS